MRKMLNGEDIRLTAALNNIKLKSRTTGESRAYKTENGIKLELYLDAFFIRGKKVPEVHIGNYLRLSDLKKIDPVAKMFLYDRKYLKINSVDVTKVLVYHLGISLADLDDHDNLFLDLQLGERDEDDLIEDITNNTAKINLKYLTEWLDTPSLHENYKGDLYTSIKLLAKLQ